ncbi:MAG TPA: hypothetical protein VFY93_14945 [Planctomycetota bacterium]|nr:hypothetical protein [Planctomycetota bacterium]
MSRASALRGVQFVVDSKGKKTAVVIDLKKNAALWEDFYDAAVAKARAKDRRWSVEDARRKLRIPAKRR